MTTPDIVTVRELTKVYRQGEINVTALNRVTLNIQTGEFLSLMGPSGSGKSTLLHIIAGVDRPTSGECLVQGVDVGKLSESELADVLVAPVRQFRLAQFAHIHSLHQTFAAGRPIHARDDVEQGGLA